MVDELITARSSLDVAATVDRLTTALDERGVTLFAVIDHAAGARGVGLELPDEVVLIFGNPAAGTPLMQHDPRVGIDLPLRILVWSDPATGSTQVGYRDPRELAERYGLAGQRDVLDRLNTVLQALLAAVAQ